MKKITVTIDGPVASGKGITARTLAQKMAYRYLDTGALYRALAMHLLQQGIESVEGREKIKEALQDVHIEFSEAGETFLNGVEVSTEIRSPRVATYASIFSVVPEIRAFLDTLQGQLIEGGWMGP